MHLCRLRKRKGPPKGGIKRKFLGFGPPCFNFLESRFVSILLIQEPYLFNEVSPGVGGNGMDHLQGLRESGGAVGEGWALLGCGSISRGGGWLAGFLRSCVPLGWCSPGRQSPLGQIEGRPFIYRFPHFWQICLVTGSPLRRAPGLVPVSHSTIEEGMPLDWDEAAGFFVLSFLASLRCLPVLRR